MGGAPERPSCSSYGRGSLNGGFPNPLARSLGSGHTLKALAHLPVERIESDDA